MASTSGLSLAPPNRLACGCSLLTLPAREHGEFVIKGPRSSLPSIGLRSKGAGSPPRRTSITNSPCTGHRTRRANGRRCEDWALGGESAAGRGAAASRAYSQRERLGSRQFPGERPVWPADAPSLKLHFSWTSSLPSIGLRSKGAGSPPRRTSITNSPCTGVRRSCAGARSAAFMSALAGGAVRAKREDFGLERAQDSGGVPECGSAFRLVDIRHCYHRGLLLV
jgi:hypothetical protein